MKALTLWKITNSANCTPIQLGLESSFQALDDISRILPTGAYTTFRTFNYSQALFLERHFLRLQESSLLMGCPVLLDKEILRCAIRKVVSGINTKELRIRLTVDLDQEPGTIYISSERLVQPEEKYYHSGVKAITYPDHRKNPKAKLTRHLIAAERIRENANQQGVNEILFVDEHGIILEGLSSNFFSVKSQIIFTAGEGVLHGTVRDAVLTILQEKRKPVILESVKINNVEEMDEAFITSTSRGILPIRSIDGKPIGTGEPGETTQMLMNAYQAWIQDHLEQI